MDGRGQPTLSIVLATHNRRETAARTLERLREVADRAGGCEIIVVDNASSDGTGEAAGKFADRVIRLRRNYGSCAKAFGVDRACGRYILFLDDDSCPRSGSIERMIGHFEGDARLGAAGFTVHLPDGRLEGAALPDVFVGCGVGFRAEALRGAGGLDRTFFMQAEEYDLAFRLAGGRWRVRVYDDLHVDHLKSMAARRSDRTTYLDVRNNLRVIARYLPKPFAEVYRQDCVQRYAWLAQRDGHEAAFRRGRRAGFLWGLCDRWRFRGRRLSAEAFEHFYRCGWVRDRMAELARSGVRRVAFADLGKNVYGFFQAAAAEGVAVAAIGDDRFAAPDRRYRGIPVVALHDAVALDIDAVVVANAAPVFAGVSLRRVCALTDRPVHAWFARKSDRLPPDKEYKPVRGEICCPTT